MYEAFYNFTIKPFRLTPDQDFCFRHPSYQRAKTYLEYIVDQGEDIVMITGKPGTGKTTLISDLLVNFDTEDRIVARLECIHMGREDLLRILAFSFNLDVQALDLTGILHNLRQFLIEQRKEGRKALLIVDEAQALSSAALEELRLLHNLQDEGHVLLQIYLVGQEELADLINRPAMAQFRQRMLAAYHLEPLNASQTEAYIKHRLRTVGWKSDPILHNEIFPLIHEFSHGIPRRINLVCNQLLTLGFENEQHELGVRDVGNAIDILRKARLIAPEFETMSEIPTLPTDSQQKVSTVSLLKEPLAVTFEQRNIDESETARLPLDALDMPSRESKRKKQSKPRKLWPMALFTLLLGGSLSGLVLAMLLTVQKPLMNILFPSEGEQEYAQERQVSTHPNLDLKDAQSPFISDSDREKQGSQYRAESMPIEEKQEPAQNNPASAGLNQELSRESRPPKSQQEPSGGSEQSRSVVSNGQTPVQIDLHRSDSTLVQPDKPLPQDSADIPRELLVSTRQNSPQKTQANDDSKSTVEAPGEVTKKPFEPTENSKPNDIKTPDEGQQIANLLEKATQQRKEFKITLPPGNNAFETYQRVLELDPTNKQAKQGIIDLAEYYRARAIFHREGGALDLSLRLILRGLRINPKHSELLALREQVQKSRDEEKK